MIRQAFINRRVGPPPGVDPAPSVADSAATVVNLARAIVDSAETAVSPAATLINSPEVRTLAPLSEALKADELKVDDFNTEIALTPSAFSARDKAFAAFMVDSIRNSLLDPHGVQFGGIAGLNWSGASARGNSGKVSGKPLSGLSLGAFADVPLRKHLSVRPRVQYSYEGYQPDANGNKVNIHVAYLGTSWDMVYHTHWLQKRFYLGGGPYLAYGMSGTYTFKGINTDMQFGSNYLAGDNLRKTDYGAGCVVGLLMDRNFVIDARFDLGLKNIAPGGFGTAIRTRSFGLSVLYVFRNRANMKTYQFKDSQALASL